MYMDSKCIIRRVIFTLLTVFCIGFVFSRSLMPGNKSGEESGKILMILNSISDFLGMGSIFTHDFVRKCAHFTEFSILSVMAFNMYVSYDLKLRIVALFLAFTYTLAAIVDETIQFFVPGRACQFTDVIIDFSGGTFGMVLCLTFFLILQKIKKKN